VIDQPPGAMNEAPSTVVRGVSLASFSAAGAAWSRDFAAGAGAGVATGFTTGGVGGGAS
jgi:hypothetical protein